MARRAKVDDIHAVARALPGVKPAEGGRVVYQVSGRSFVFFRGPRPDALDPETGERYADVIVFWVESEEVKHAFVDDDSSPYFTTPHFVGHPSVLLREAHLGLLDVDEITEVVQDAWLARASKTAAKRWLAQRGLD